MTLLERLDQFPPRLCRFVARKKHGTAPMSHRDIAAASGLKWRYVAVLSFRRTWRGVPIEVIEAFSRACGVDLMRTKRTVEYLKRCKRAHLTGGNANQRKFLSRLMSA